MIPLIDVMLVLLVIFIITAPLLTHAVKIDLPKAASAPNLTKPDNIQLAIDAGGEIFWNGEVVSRAVLNERLSAAGTAGTAARGAHPGRPGRALPVGGRDARRRRKRRPDADRLRVGPDRRPVGAANRRRYRGAGRGKSCRSQSSSRTFS